MNAQWPQNLGYTPKAVWSCHVSYCTWKPLLTVSASIMLVYESCQDLSIIYLRVVNNHRFNQSDLDTRSWCHGTAASMEYRLLLCTPSSPDHSRLVPLALDYTRLSRPKPNQEPVRRLLAIVLKQDKKNLAADNLAIKAQQQLLQNLYMKQCSFQASRNQAANKARPRPRTEKIYNS